MGKNEPQDPKAQQQQSEEEEDRSPCCACCCKADEEKRPGPEYLEDGKLFENRSCTDCCMILFYGIFLIGWIVLISLAAAYGKPDRIIKPENYRGDLCGEGRLGGLPFFWVPLPSRATYGFCVPKCPAVGDIVCNNDIETLPYNSSASEPNSYFSTTASQFTDDLAAYGRCKVSDCSAADKVASNRYISVQLKLSQRKCLTSFYPSSSSLLRCIPGRTGKDVNTTLLSLANESVGNLGSLADAFGVGSFFQLGFAEIDQCWRVILISSFTCMGIAVVWVLLLRWILAPIVYFVIFLILAVLIGLGFIFRYLADDLAQGALPGETGVENQEKLWRAAQWASFILAGIYFGVMLHMLQRIRIAIAIMKEASKAFMAAPSMVFVPLVTFFVLIGWVAFFIVTTIYIQTMGSDANEAFALGTKSLLGVAINITKLVSDQNVSSFSSTDGNASSFLNVSRWSTLPETKVLHLYNFFGVLWTGNICLMFGFMTLAMTICSWYFSANQHDMTLAKEGLSAEQQEEMKEKKRAEKAAKKNKGNNNNGEQSAEQQQEDAQSDVSDVKVGKEKHTVAFVVPRAAWCTFWNHLGTVIWGALCIAIIQFIRAIFTYVAENYLKNAKENVTVKILLRCAQCCLWYIEQVVKIISKNAFIVTAIKNTNFCVSAYQALKLLLSNAARLVILTMLSTATIFLVKLFIVGINFMIAFALIKNEALTGDKAIESGLFPLFLICIMSFVIASLFLNVYEACIDTLFLCFLIDEDEYNAEYMPESLAKIIDLFKGAEEARLEYEKTVQSAMAKAEVAEAKK